MTLATQATGDDKLASVGQEMRKWMDQVLRSKYHHYCRGETWSPSVNVYEDAATFHVIVDLAGVKSDEIDLRVCDDVMILSGKRKPPVMKKSAGRLEMHLMEIDHGTYCRELELPKGLDVNAISAEYRNGFLWIRLPKKEA